MRINTLKQLKSIWCGQKRKRSHNQQLYFRHNHKNEAIVWKHGPYCWYVCLNLKYLGWPYRAYIKTAKNDDFCEELLSENDLEAVLATSVVKTTVARLLTQFRRSLQIKKTIVKAPRVLPKYTYQSITLKNGWLQGYLRRSWNSSWSYAEKRAITGPWWVLSIMEVR